MAGCLNKPEFYDVHDIQEHVAAAEEQGYRRSRLQEAVAVAEVSTWFGATGRWPLWNRTRTP